MGGGAGDENTHQRIVMNTKVCSRVDMDSFCISTARRTWMRFLIRAEGTDAEAPLEYVPD